MKRLLNDFVMAQYNMYGGGNKKGFASTTLCQMVIDSVKGRSKDATENDIKKVVQDYLRNAPARCKLKESKEKQ